MPPAGPSHGRFRQDQLPSLQLTPNMTGTSSITGIEVWECLGLYWPTKRYICRIVSQQQTKAVDVMIQSPIAPRDHTSAKSKVLSVATPESDGDPHRCCASSMAKLPATNALIGHRLIPLPSDLGLMENAGVTLTKKV